MARSATCHDRPLGRRSDTLMPVSPKDDSVEKGLTRNGDTADGVGLGEAEDQEDEGGEAEEEEDEAVVSFK